MKHKLLAVTVAAFLLLNLAACAQENPENSTLQPGDGATTFPGVELSISGITRTEQDTVLHLSWKNDTEYSVLYGENFWLQQLVDGQWVSLEPKENTGFISIGYSLQPGASYIKSYSTEWIYGVLERPGTYRFKTNCIVYDTPEGTNCDLYVEFTLHGLEEWGYVPVPDFQDYHKPPVLTLKLGTALKEYSAASCSWFYYQPAMDAAPEKQTLIIDGKHPLLCMDTLKRMDTTVPEAILEFEVMPDDITVRCWPDSMFGNPNAQADSWQGNRFNLKPAINGGYVYEITCTWNDKGGYYHGTATYYLYIACYPVTPIQPRS